MRQRIRRSSFLVAGVAAAGLHVAPAFSDTPKAYTVPVLKEVIVTATKQKESLQNVPIAMTAISATGLKNRGVHSVIGLNALAPNVYVSENPGAPLISIISIRGETTGQPAIWMDPPVGVYLDGVYLGKAQGGVLNLVDLDHVEIIRGPAGTSFGRNTEGGAINFISKQPTGRFGGHLEVAGGEYDHQIYSASVNLPKFSIFSVSLSARDEKMDGWARNRTGPPLGAIHHQGFRGVVKFDFTRRLVGTYAFLYSNANDTPGPTSLYALSGWEGTFPQIFGSSPNPAAAYGGYVLGTAIQSALAPYITTRRPSTVSTFGPDNNADFDRAKNTMHTFTLEYRLNDNNHLKYIFARRRLFYDDQQNLNGTPVASTMVTYAPGFTIPQALDASYNRITNYTQTSDELQWIGRGAGLQYYAGLYYFKDSGTTFDAEDFSIFSTPAMYQNYGTGTSSKAAYAQVAYTFLKDWTVTVGDRYTKESKSGWTHAYDSQGFQGPFVTDSVPGTLPYTPYIASWSQQTPMGTIAYRINSDANVYFRAAKGFKSGGFSGELDSPAVTKPFNPETSVMTELGAKTTLLGGRARIDADIFRTKISDMQLTQLLPGTVQSFVANAGSATYQGFELEAAAVVARGWTLQANYGYLDTKFNTYITNPIIQLTGPYANGFDNGLYVNNSNASINAASNLVPPYAPRNTFDVNVDGRLLRTSLGNLRLIVDWSYVSTTYTFVANENLNAPNAGGQFVTSMDNLAPRPNVNARLVFDDVRVPGGSAEFALAVENLTNYNRPVQTIDYGMMLTADWEAPRMWTLSATYKFGD